MGTNDEHETNQERINVAEMTATYGPAYVRGVDYGLLYAQVTTARLRKMGRAGSEGAMVLDRLAFMLNSTRCDFERDVETEAATTSEELLENKPERRGEGSIARSCFERADRHILKAAEAIDQGGSSGRLDKAVALLFEGRALLWDHANGVSNEPLPPQMPAEKLTLAFIEKAGETAAALVEAVAVIDALLVIVSPASLTTGTMRMVRHVRDAAYKESGTVEAAARKIDSLLDPVPTPPVPDFEAVAREYCRLVGSEADELSRSVPAWKLHVGRIRETYFTLQALGVL